MIVSSNTYFPKDYKTGYKYCLMVNRNNKVDMVWNYNAREYMDIVDENDNNLGNKYTVNEVKKMYEKNIIHFKFIFSELKG